MLQHLGPIRPFLSVARVHLALAALLLTLRETMG